MSFHISFWGLNCGPYKYIIADIPGLFGFPQYHSFVISTENIQKSDRILAFLDLLGPQEIITLKSSNRYIAETNFSFFSGVKPRDSLFDLWELYCTILAARLWLSS